MGLGRNPPKEEGGGDIGENNLNFAAAQLFLNHELLNIPYYEKQQ